MTEVRSQRAETLARARAHAQAAEAIVMMPGTPAFTATSALRECWSALADAREEDGATLDGLQWLPAASRDPLRGPLQALHEGSDELTDDDCLALTRGAFEALRSAEVEVLGHALDPSSGRRLATVGLAGLAAVIGLGWALAATSGSPREGPWRTAYYDGPSFESPALVQHEGDVRFEWADGPAHPDGPRDHFSVRFESCLRTDGGPVAFQLVSNDAATLYVDGALVVDNGGEHRERARGTELELPTGVHHLRVDYREYEGRAMVALLASLDGRRPKAIEVPRLSLPAGDGTCEP